MPSPIPGHPIPVLLLTGFPGAAKTTLNGTSTFTGRTTVEAGSRIVNSPGGNAVSTLTLNQDLDREAVTAKLDACLLSDEEMAPGPSAWARLFSDPFLPWRRADEVTATDAANETMIRN